MDDAQESVGEDVRITDCPHEDAVYWNPYNHVVQCHRCGEVFVPGRAATPADAIFGFMIWLSSREEVAGPFSRNHDLAQPAELAREFCDYNGWEVGPNFPDTYRIPEPKGE